MNHHTRRAFLQQAGVFLSATALQYKTMAGVSPSEKIHVGFIGVGGMGTNRLKQFMRHEDVAVGAICDVDQGHLDRAVAEVEKRKGYKPKGYRDFRQLLDRNDLDAVVVVTPDHWHALPFIRACEAGCDVFVEKPLSYSIGEGRAMLNAANKHKRITQLGNHIHNEYPNYRRVVEMVRSGHLGDITKVHCWRQPGNKGIGNPPNAQPPKDLDYDFWLGPAPKRPYNENRSHFNFRYFWDYSGGSFIDFWCHITDVVYWALDLPSPISASAIGRRHGMNDNAETPNYMEALLEYPEITMNWSIHPRPFPGFAHMGNIGAVFQGSEASLVTNYKTHEIYVDGKKQEDFPRPEPSIPDSPGHLREFLNAIKSRKECTCNIAYAHHLTKGGHLANISYRAGDKVYWDDKNESVLNNPNAEKLVTRHYRRPWFLG